MRPNRFAAFRCDINLAEAVTIRILITARSFYRLYAKGELISHGPARAGHGALRIDELPLAVPTGRVCLAVELAAYSSTDHYSNNCTLESGLLLSEVWDGETLLAATGNDIASQWFCAELHHRKSDVELISHSHEMLTFYKL